MNNEVIDVGIKELVKIKVFENWKIVKEENNEFREDLLKFIKEIVRFMNRLEGDVIFVFIFIKNKVDDGMFMYGIIFYEKRGIVLNVLEWIFERCI